jgi:ABC-type nitrate/sulfonate/bicarbonate transport system substrate-binding protein
VAFGQAKPIQIANASGSTSLTIQQMLKDGGYLEQFGVKANIINVADGSKIVAGIIGGDIDLSMMSGFGQIFPAMEKGAKLKVLGGAAVLPSLALYTTKPDIKTLKDLEGRTVGTGAPGALLHSLVVGLMIKYGVDYKKVRFVNIGSSVDVLRGVIAGTVDAGPGEMAAMDNPATKVKLVEHGNMSIELKEYTYQGAWTSDGTIANAEKRAEMVKLMAAHSKLYHFVNTSAAKDAFIKARKVVLPAAPEADHLAQWKYIDTYKPFEVNIALNEERMRYMQQLNVDLGVQQKVLPFKQVADFSIANEGVKLMESKKG